VSRKAGPIAVLFAVLGLALLGLVPALAQDAAEPLRARLTDAKAKLSSIEAALSRESVDDASLSRLRNDIDPLRIELVALQNDATGPRDASRERLDKLGQPPKPEDPPESADVAAARKREQATFGALDGIIKEAQVQVVRADQLANTVTERRRDAFTRELTQRTSSILDPYFWLDVASDLPRAGWSLMLTAQDTANYFSLRAKIVPLAIALGIILGGTLVARLVRRRLRLMRAHLAERESGSSRFRGSLETVLSVLYALSGWPMAALIPVAALRIADLVPERTLDQFGYGLFGALVIAVLFDATGEGVLAVGKSQLRLLPLSDWAARRIRRRVRWIAIVLGAYAFAQAVGRSIYAPISLTVATTALASLILALIATSLLVRLRSAPTEEEGEGAPETINRLDILRPFLWIATIAIYVCLLTGYIALAGFFAVVPIATLFIAAVAYVLITLIDTTLTEGLADGRHARAAARAIGMSPKNIAFAGTLLSGLLRFVVIAVAAFTVASPFGFYSADIFSATQRAFFGFSIGEFTISPSSILLGLALLGLILALTRLVQNWIRGTLLPRTTLDAGLQNSIATIVGYVGVVLASAVALSEVGLDLQNFAIVAGALSVGIGFGLQSIVSNFVSGLILLAERPIRVGDIIAVGGEEGFVRRISVRATEIETYDRATLIIPNSQLITGTVKNWVYGNTWSRVRVTLSVGYDADVEAVRAAMLAAAEGDPRILPTPPPRVFLAKLGDAALEFELVAVVASVETMPAVRSDLHLRILKRFREKGIRVAAQVPAAPPPVVVSLEQALGAVEIARKAADKVSEG
jgi:potassium-dependent mechanosensitive channel